MLVCHNLICKFIKIKFSRDECVGFNGNIIILITFLAYFLH